MPQEIDRTDASNQGKGVAEEFDAIFSDLVAAALSSGSVRVYLPLFEHEIAVASGLTATSEPKALYPCDAPMARYFSPGAFTNEEVCSILNEALVTTQRLTPLVPAAWKLSATNAEDFKMYLLRLVMREDPAVESAFSTLEAVERDIRALERDGLLLSFLRDRNEAGANN